VASIATAVISLKLLQNCEILTIIQWFTQSSYWLILRFLTIFMMIFSTQCSYFRDITPCSPLKSQPTRLATYFHAGIFLGLFDPDDGGDMFLRNVAWLSTDYTALYPTERLSNPT
jgi:hypothetical protein